MTDVQPPQAARDVLLMPFTISRLGGLSLFMGPGHDDNAHRLLSIGDLLAEAEAEEDDDEEEGEEEDDEEIRDVAWFLGRVGLRLRGRVGTLLTSWTTPDAEIDVLLMVAVETGPGSTTGHGVWLSRRRAMRLVRRSGITDPVVVATVRLMAQMPLGRLWWLLRLEVPALARHLAALRRHGIGIASTVLLIAIALAAAIVLHS
jgi:hypothetical protein